MSEGIVNVRFSPTHAPRRPSSQPRITWPIPTKKDTVGTAGTRENSLGKNIRLKDNGWPRSRLWYLCECSTCNAHKTTHLESNLAPPLNRVPVWIFDETGTAVTRTCRTHVVNGDGVPPACLLGTFLGHKRRLDLELLGRLGESADRHCQQREPDFEQLHGKDLDALP